MDRIEQVRITTGIAGLDEMLGGGIPKGHAVAVIGNFGTGKTTFSLQFTHAGLVAGEKVLYISLEEDQDSILLSASLFGWDLKPYVENGQLQMVRLEPQDAKATIGQIQSDLPRAIRELGAARIVIDSVSLLNLLYKDSTEIRNQMYALVNMIKRSGATLLMTAEVRQDNPMVSRDGEVEYVVDGVILLHAREAENQVEIQLRISILKMRRAAHSRAVRPYTLGEGGLNVMADTMVY